MSYMIFSAKIQGTRVLGLLYSSHVVGLQMAIHPPSPYFSLNIPKVDVIDNDIIIILELESPILIQYLGFALLTVFLGGGGLSICIIVGIQFTHKSKMPISRRLIRILPKVFFKIIPIIDEFILVNPFRDLGTAIEGGMFLQEFNFGPVPMAYTQGGEEEVI